MRNSFLRNKNAQNTQFNVVYTINYGVELSL